MMYIRKSPGLCFSPGKASGKDVLEASGNNSDSIAAVDTDCHRRFRPYLLGIKELGLSRVLEFTGGSSCVNVTVSVLQMGCSAGKLVVRTG